MAECNIQRPSQMPSLVVFIRHIISEVLQYRRHPFRARRHPWSEPDAILGGSPLNRDFANIGEPECMLDNIGERYTCQTPSLVVFIRHMSQGRVCRLDAGYWSFAYCRSGKKPNDIPATPEKVYADAGWAGSSDWLGNSTAAAS